ncbi:MAG: family 78 glycoside hydrolase catalytic domain [Bacteroidales bacterium]|nr:family 78 glycoside hydrolase catalytic domain [Bacteroidales bacterium]
MDFEINQVAAGPCFGMTGPGNFYMWQINIATNGKPANTIYFRPHEWKNGNVRCFKEVEISDKIKIEKNVVYHLRIDIQGKMATTYINDILVDISENPSGVNYALGNLGFRHSFGDGNVAEQAYYDNMLVTKPVNGNDSTLFAEDFSKTNYAFTGGTLNNGRLYVAYAGSDALVWQKKSAVHFKLETDMTLLSDNAGVIFSATDVNNMHMWSINTHDQSQPILRRHIYINGNPVAVDVPIGSFFTKADLIGTEHHVTIEADNNIITTYIDDTLIDTYSDQSGSLIIGNVGFRAFNDNLTNEAAYYDNVVLTDYLPNTSGIEVPVIMFSENFENESNAFEGAETVDVAGNTKLNMFAKNGELRILEGQSFGIPMFRTKFNVDKTIKSAKAYSSALGVYDLFINGQRVGTTMDDGNIVYDELKPGFTTYTKTAHYSTYDVTSLLKSGGNAIGAHVASGYWSGGIAQGWYGSPDLNFIAKLVLQFADGSSQTIVTDPSWLTSNNGPIRMADIYNGETYDARKESDWTTADYDDSGWLQTAVSNDFKGTLKALVGPSVQVRPELAISPLTTTIYEGTNATGTTHGAIDTLSTMGGQGVIQLRKGQTIIYDMGQNMAGWVKFTAKGAAGAKITLRFGEMLNDNGASSRGNDGAAGSLYTANLRTAKATLNYTFKGNEEGETYQPSLSYFGFRYCEVSANRDIEISSITAEVVGSATEEGSSFKTSNEMINKLYSNILWGQRSNFVSVPTDCPQRDERKGWTGDAQIFSRAAAYNANVASFFHKWMGDMRDSQRSDGAYSSIAPVTFDGFGRGAWADAGIIVPWNIYLMYDDEAIITENYSSMEKYMGFLATQSGGGYLYNGGVDEYGDWLSYESLENRYVSVCYYAYDARLMSKMSKALSKSEGDMYDLNRIKYDNLYNNIKTEFISRYVFSDGMLKQSSQTAYLLALKLDLFPNDLVKTNGVKYLVQKIAANGNKLSTGFLGTGILNQTLSELGESNTAYNLLLQRGNPSWLYSIDQGATTIWERWNSYTLEKGFGDVSMNSFNHYSYGAVTEWMFRYMGGIETDEKTPGFKHIVLQPTPDTRTILPDGQPQITSAEAVYKSNYGNIKSSWAINDAGKLVYNATVPANTTATLYFPLNDSTDVVYEGTILAENAVGVTFIKWDSGKAIYDLESGDYSFAVNINTALNNPNAKKEFSIFPNPVSTILNLANETVPYTVTNLVGKKMLSGNGQSVDVCKLNEGMYIVEFNSTICKFIKN